MPSSKEPRPFLLSCRCGYQKKLSAKYAGKKVICPKCDNALRVPSAPVAMVIVRCPYCKSEDELQPDLTTCIHCEKDFALPAFLATPSPASPESEKSLVPPTGKPIDATSGNDDGPSISIAPSTLKRKKSLAGPVLGVTTLIGFGLAGYLLWEKSQEKTASVPVVAKDPNGGLIVEPPKKDDEAPKAEAAKLVGPCVEIGEVAQDFAQALDPETSEVVGNKLFIEITLKNITDCQITGLTVAAKLLNPEITEDEMSKTVTFDRPFEPGTERTTSIAFPQQTTTGAIVRATDFLAGEQTENTEVKKEIRFSE